MSKACIERVFLSPPAVAKMLGISPDSVVGFITAGELEAFNVGRGAKRPRWRISPQAIEKFQQRRSAVTKTEAIRRPRRDKAVKSFV